MAKNSHLKIANDKIKELKLKTRRFLDEGKYNEEKDYGKIYGNIKDKCYNCSWVSILFDKKNCRFIPYCKFPGHKGRLVNVDYNKWNTTYDERERIFLSKVLKKDC